jgi:glycosyltransferase involved in cell wall biosynthesis
MTICGAILSVPTNDVVDPEVSVVVPALDESLTIESFVMWCHEGFIRAGVRGEVLIVDSSMDDTPVKALALGARVLKVPKRGLGQAYRDAMPYIRGDFVVMGDADCTYDFREIGLFVQAWRGGAEFVMGSRWKGSIEKGAMPALHQYFGTPATTFVLNRIYRSRYTDIHCGMRGATIDALRRIDIQSQSWEYASEMVLKAARLGLVTVEVPVHFMKDPPGRTSHHRRMGWWSPWYAGWINLKAMFLYGADGFLVTPGALIGILGALLMLGLSVGDVEIFGIGLSLSAQVFGLVAFIAGWQWFLLGMITRSFLDLKGMAVWRSRRLFAYSRAVMLSGIASLVGLAMLIPLIVVWSNNGFVLTPTDTRWIHLFVAGAGLVASGFTYFASTLAFCALDMRFLLPSRVGEE